MESNNIFKVVSVVSLLAVLGLWFNGGKTQVSSLSASGQGIVSAKPESVSLVVTRVSVGDKPASVIDDGELGLKKLIEVAKRIGGENAEIKKSFYQITPQANGTYILVNAFSVKSKKVSETTNLIKDLYASGATTVSEVSFEPVDKDAAELKAKTEAVKDAKARASQMAKAAGKTLGKILTVSEDDTGSATTVKNSDSEISITKNVSIIYEIR